MPVMDGFQVMAGLKANIKPVVTDDYDHQSKLSTYLPVIVLTAEPGHKLRALNAGARDFISKPFDLIEVKTRIHHMLEVRLLYKKIAEQNRLLQEALKERTGRLLLSEDPSLS